MDRLGSPGARDQGYEVPQKGRTVVAAAIPRRTSSIDREDVGRLVESDVSAASRQTRRDDLQAPLVRDHRQTAGRLDVGSLRSSLGYRRDRKERQQLA